jgi:hypothetical protein
LSQVASTTYSTVEAEFYQSGFNYISDTGQSARALRWINQSYQEVCSMENWPFLRTVVTQAAPVSLPLLSRIVRVTDTSTSGGNRLYEGDEDMLADLNPDLSLAGTPAYYYLTYAAGAPSLNVYPVSTHTIEVVYFQNPTPLASPGDVLIIPDQFIDVVVLGAMRRGYLDGTDTAQQYQMVKQEYADRLEFMRTQLLPRPSYQALSTWPDASEDW